jgi:hypothetical protein
MAGYGPTAEQRWHRLKGPQFNHIRDLAIDHLDRIWLATASGAALRDVDATWTYFGNADPFGDFHLRSFLVYYRETP